MTLLFHSLLVFTTLTTILATGLVFTFALIVMPGIGRLGDREFLRAFQEIDGIIQRSPPVFILVWAGSILSLLATVVLAVGRLEVLPLALLMIAAALYIFGVQVPTVRGNIPLNNDLQKLKLNAMDAPALASTRAQFEGPWNRLNVFRTVVAIVVSILLLVVLLNAH